MKNCKYYYDEFGNKKSFNIELFKKEIPIEKVKKFYTKDLLYPLFCSTELPFVNSRIAFLLSVLLLPLV